MLNMLNEDCIATLSPEELRTFVRTLKEDKTKLSYVRISDVPQNEINIIKASQVKEHPEEQPEEQINQHPSGAKSTTISARFDLICPLALRRLALRYGLGAQKYEDNQWCKGQDDFSFKRDRLNHILNHLNLYMLEGCKNDDNLAAAAWGIFALMHFEDKCKHHETLIDVLK